MNIKEKLEKYRFDDPQLLQEMTDALKKTYYKYVDEDSLNQPEFKQDIEDHLFKRYHNTLFNYVPWIMECFGSLTQMLKYNTDFLLSNW